MYVSPNFSTKKALKDAIANGERVTVFQPNDMFGKTDEIRSAEQAEVSVEGPHYPKAHSWYARVRCLHGIVTEVLS